MNYNIPLELYKFLSSNTQDFIEVSNRATGHRTRAAFLSSNTQDFIEVSLLEHIMAISSLFLSSNTQDFIEVVFTVERIEECL